MEMRRHSRAKAKEKEAKDDFQFHIKRSVDQHTHGVDQHQFRLSKVHDAFKFTEKEICPKRLFYLHY